MNSKYEKILITQIEKKFNLKVESLELIGGMDLPTFRGEQIEKKLIEIKNKAELSSFPFKRDFSEEDIDFFLINKNLIVTFYDSSELFQDPAILNGYFLKQ